MNRIALTAIALILSAPAAFAQDVIVCSSILANCTDADGVAYDGDGNPVDPAAEPTAGEPELAAEDDNDGGFDDDDDSDDDN